MRVPSIEGHANLWGGGHAPESLVCLRLHFAHFHSGESEEENKE